MTESLIKNCRDKVIYVNEVDSQTDEEINNDNVNDDIMYAISRLDIQEPFSIDEYINPMFERGAGDEIRDNELIASATAIFEGNCIEHDEIGDTSSNSGDEAVFVRRKKSDHITSPSWNRVRW
ncbi:hypothetical protein RCL1_007922 [Eukaryota sp. TZLM3-RCL]